MRRKTKLRHMNTPPLPPEIVTIIDAYPMPARTGILTLRNLIFDVARELPEVDTVREVIRWGQPAYMPQKPRVGTSLRLGLHRDAHFALFAHCQTTVIASYAQAFPGWDRLDGNRAILFDDLDQIEPERLQYLIRCALTYHLKEKP